MIAFCPKLVHLPRTDHVSFFNLLLYWKRTARKESTILKPQSHTPSPHVLTALERWLSDHFNPIALRLMFFGKATISDLREAVRWEREH